MLAGTRSGSRLVTRTVTCAEASSRRRTTSGPSASASRLSSTPGRRWSGVEGRQGRGQVVRRRAAQRERDLDGQLRPGGRLGHLEVGDVGELGPRTAVAINVATRDLPLPPMPVRVTSRTSGSAQQRRDLGPTSSSRPNVVEAQHRDAGPLPRLHRRGRPGRPCRGRGRCAGCPLPAAGGRRRARCRARRPARSRPRRRPRSPPRPGRCGRARSSAAPTAARGSGCSSTSGRARSTSSRSRP